MLSSLSTLRSGKTAETRHAKIQDTESGQRWEVNMLRGHEMAGQKTPIATNPALHIERCWYPNCVFS
jgi:hypothetical protein